MTKIIYKENIKTLKEWADAYYEDDNPIASDEEYDRLYHEVLEYERLNPDMVDSSSPTRVVGGVVRSGFSKAKHIKRMWSMEDVFDTEEMEEWLKRVAKSAGEVEYFCEPKFDGISMNLLYDGGTLKSAITRGNGVEGEEVIDNIRTISSIPQTIGYKDLIEIRGEIVIRKDDFEIINQDRLKDGKSLFANPRNATAGSIRVLDSSITAKRRLVFYPWGLGQNRLKETLLSKRMEYIYNLGFIKPPYSKECRGIDDIEKFYCHLISKRDEIEVMMDGMVVKVDDTTLQEALGYTIKVPRWMCAYKFPAVERSTRVNSITLQVGRTGVITPVAELEPVDIDGAIVSRATLHNFDEIERKGLMVGDSVILIRSGDVIPKITKVLVERRDGSQKSIKRPTYCPTCQSELLDEKTLIKCQNLECSDRVIGAIIHFAQKKCMNIEGLGSKIVEQLVKEKIIKNILELYSIKPSDLEGLDGFKERRIERLLSAIESSRGKELSKLIFSMGIEHIGEVASRSIALEFGLRFIDLEFDELISIDGIGDEMANSYLEFMRVNYNSIKSLLEVITPKVEKKVEIEENIFKAKSVVLTGSMSVSRAIIKSMLEKLGAKVNSAVSKKTDFLIYGEDGGSKLDKAKKLGVEMISEEQMREMLE